MQQRTDGRTAPPRDEDGSDGQRRIDRIIGNVLRRHRTLAARTQKSLADEIGVSFQQLQKYESGVNRIAVTRLLDVCGALGLPPEEMIAEIASSAGPRPGQAPVADSCPAGWATAAARPWPPALRGRRTS